MPKIWRFLSNFIFQAKMIRHLSSNCTYCNLSIAGWSLVIHVATPTAGSNYIWFFLSYHWAQMTVTLCIGLLACFTNLPSKISTKQRYVQHQTSLNHFRMCCLQVKLSCRGWSCVFSASCVWEINHSALMSLLVHHCWQDFQSVLHLVIMILSIGQ